MQNITYDLYFIIRVSVARGLYFFLLLNLIGIDIKIDMFLQVGTSNRYNPVRLGQLVQKVRVNYIFFFA